MEALYNLVSILETLLLKLVNILLIIEHGLLCARCSGGVFDLFEDAHVS